MSDELKTSIPEDQHAAEKSAQPKAERTFEPIKEEVFKEALEVLYDEGGFDIVSSTIPGADNMEPGPMQDVFLTDAENKDEREALQLRLRLWIDMLSTEANVGNMIEKSLEVGERSGQLLKANLKRGLETTRELETNYRALASFFVNAGGDKPVKNLAIMNASMDKITDMDSRRFIEHVAVEFKDKYDRLDLMNNYSLLVIPGYLGAKHILDEWGRLAHDHKVMLITDFMNLESTDQVMKVFERTKLTGADEFRANMMMTCNWLIGREQYTDAGEEEPLFIPPSAALAGKLYSGNMAQVAAGVKHGVTRAVVGSRFIIHASDLSKLGDIGLIPMVYEYGQVQAFSKSTLFNGTNQGMQTYSVVRTFDWLTKCMMDFLNRKVFINISVNEEMAIRNEVSRFFDKCVREHKFLEKVTKIDIKRDPDYKDRLQLYVHATPYFPAKNFVLRLDGKSGESPGDVNKYASKFEG